MQKSVEVTILIPCLNEEETIGYVVDKAFEGLKKSGKSGEILVVDNESTDNSPTIARKHNARVVSCKIIGYGAALRKGFSVAKGNYIIIVDADGSYDVSVIQPFIVNLQKGYDIVVGSRFRGKIHNGSMPFINRYIGTPFLTFLLNRILQTDYTDCNSGMRAFRKDVLAKIKIHANGMNIATELLIEAYENQLKTKEIAIDYFPDRRKTKRSHLHPVPDGLRHLTMILGYLL